MALSPVRVNEQTHEELAYLRRELSARFRRDFSNGEIITLIMNMATGRGHDADVAEAVKELIKKGIS